MCFKTLIILIFCMTSFPVLALVDYSDEVNAPSRSMTTVKKPVFGQKPPKTQRAQSSSSTFNSHMDFGLGYHSTTLESEQGDEKVNFYNLEGRFSTNYNVFMDFKYWYAKTDSSLSETTDYQKGNPTLLLGFNWFKFGNPSDLATIDFYAGAMFSEKNSDLASSRTDKIFGIETTKRFYSLLLALGYEMRLTGTPDNEDEMSIGTVQKLTAGLAWQATPDIKFAIEASRLKIAASTDDSRASKLDEPLAVSSVTPQLILSLASSFELGIGMTIRNKRVDDPYEYTDARLWDLGGIYGNSYFTTMNFSL